MMATLNTKSTINRILVSLALMFISWMVNAQDIVVEDRYEEVFGQRPALHCGVRSDINFDDASIGGTIGVINAKRNLIFFSSFDARPYRRKVIEFIGNNTYYQYMQERFMVGAGLTYKKSFKDAPMGMYAQLNTSYLWGNHGGTNRKPEKGIIIVPKMGLYWEVWRNLALSFGYSYLDMKDSEIDRHRFSLSFSTVLGNNR